MAAAMPQIKKIVWLMLENRSLDNLLGWLYQGEKLPPNRVFPKGSSQYFEGITASCVNSVDTTKYAPSKGTQGRFQPLRQPRWNPNEWFENVGNQMYWDAHGKDRVPRWSATPPMTGFARDYSSRFDTYEDVHEVMGAYSKEQLPALYGLAESFAVCDRWFSSVPTETNPNRAFSICGTSLGAVNNADITEFDTRTVFNALTESSPRKSWGIYYQYNGFWDMDPRWFGTCFTVDIFPHIRRAIGNKEGVVGKYHDEFFDALAGPDLPDLCYIEPFSSGGYGFPSGDDFMGLQGNDYHAPAWVGQAEWDLNTLYNALIGSRYWDDMLFIISFDEHGGNYDHVPPPTTVKPDSVPSREKFDFTRMGPRVPMILVSPYVQPGLVFRAPLESKSDFEHTSFIATILKWAGLDPATANLGARVANAPTFEKVLSTTRYVRDAPTFDVPVHYATLGGPKGAHHLPDDSAG